jgi:hypothetical protein
MGRHEVPEHDRFLETELCEDAVDDRRACLRRPMPRQLAFRREGDAAHPCAAIAGGLSDQQDLRRAPRLQVGAQPLPAELSSSTVAVEVEGRPDARLGQVFDESLRGVAQAS